MHKSSKMCAPPKNNKQTNNNNNKQTNLDINGLNHCKLSVFGHREPEKIIKKQHWEHFTLFNTMSC